MDNILIYWLWLLRTLNGNSRKVRALISHFGSIGRVTEATEEDLLSVDFLQPSEKDALISKNELDNAEATFRFCMSKGIEIIPFTDGRYPAELTEIDNPPAVLFAYGNISEAFSKPKISIVGTRDSTPYGEITSAKISGALAKSGFTIVAGVADGIDSSVIEAALKVDGSVIAILPGGHTRTQFSSKYKFKNIPLHGVILSENLPDTPTYKSSYYERNRLLSGMSLGVIVTQAPVKSGALITANCALNQGKDVFALLANVDMPQSQGSNNLLREGAIPVIDHTDVVNYYISSLGTQINANVKFDPREVCEALQPDPVERIDDFHRVVAKTFTDEQQIVFKHIGLVETDINFIIEETQLPVATVMSTLSELEAAGVITACPGNKYIIKF